MANNSKITIDAKIQTATEYNAKTFKNIQSTLEKLDNYNFDGEEKLGKDLKIINDEMEKISKKGVQILKTGSKVSGKNIEQVKTVANDLENVVKKIIELKNGINSSRDGGIWSFSKFKLEKDLKFDDLLEGLNKKFTEGIQKKLDQIDPFKNNTYTYGTALKSFRDDTKKLNELFEKRNFFKEEATKNSYSEQIRKTYEDQLNKSKEQLEKYKKVNDQIKEKQNETIMNYVPENWKGKIKTPEEFSEAVLKTKDTKGNAKSLAAYTKELGIDSILKERKSYESIYNKVIDSNNPKEVLNTLEKSDSALGNFITNNRSLLDKTISGKGTKQTKLLKLIEDSKNKEESIKIEGQKRRNEDADLRKAYNKAAVSAPKEVEAFVKEQLKDEGISTVFQLQEHINATTQDIMAGESFLNNKNTIKAEVNKKINQDKDINEKNISYLYAKTDYVKQGNAEIEKAVANFYDDYLKELVGDKKEEILTSIKGWLKANMSKLRTDEIHNLIQPLVGGDFSEDDFSYNDMISSMSISGLLDKGAQLKKQKKKAKSSEEKQAINQQIDDNEKRIEFETEKMAMQINARNQNPKKYNGESRLAEMFFQAYDQGKLEFKNDSPFESFTEEQYNQLKNNNNVLDIALNEAEQYSGVLDKIATRYNYIFDLSYVFEKAIQFFRQAVQNTKEVDRDMTQIGLVLGKTSGEIWGKYNEYSAMANRLGTTTAQVTASMKLFYQQGLNTADVNKMVEASAIAAALGESTMAEASETLTSIINSYGLGADEAMTVTDKISAIAIKSAADFGELSKAIEKVASSAATAGLDLDHMMGFLAKTIETTREAPANIGTFLKTITANFTEFQENPEKVNEDGFTANDVDQALQDIDINLFDTSGQMRDLGDVIDELGGRWEDLTRNQKAYLATAIAGNRQSSRFYALMNDYDRTLELVAEGTNSAGSAQRQFQLYSNSLEATFNRLTVQVEKFYNSAMKGNGLIGFFTKLATALMKVANTIGVIPTLVGVTQLVAPIRGVVNNFGKIEKIKALDPESEEYFRAIEKSKLTPGRENILRKLTTGKDLTWKEIFNAAKEKTDKNQIPEKSNAEKTIEAINESNKTQSEILDNVKKIAGEKVEPKNDSDDNEINTEDVTDTNNEDIGSKIKNGFDSVKNKIKTRWDAITNKENWKNGFGSVKNKIKTGWDAITSKENWKNGFATTWNWLKGFGSKAKEFGAKTVISTQNLGANLLGSLKTTLFTTLLTWGVKTGGKLIGAIFDGISGKYNIKKADEAKDKADNLTTLQEDFANLSLKVVRTAEEEEQLRQVRQKMIKIDGDLNKALNDTTKSYIEQNEAIQNSIKKYQQEEAENREKATVKNYSGISRFFVMLDEGLERWSGIAAGNGSQVTDDLVERRRGIFRDLTQDVITARGLTSKEAEILTKRSEASIAMNEPGTSVKAMDRNLNDWADMISDMTIVQSKTYDNFLSTYNNENASYDEIRGAYNQAISILPKELLKSFSSDMNTLNENLKEFSLVNGISEGFLSSLNISTIRQLGSIDTSALTKQEKAQFNSDLKDFLSDWENIWELNEAIAGDDLTEFAEKLLATGEYSEVFISTLTGLSDAATLAKTALTSLSKMDEIQKNIQDYATKGLSEKEKIELIVEGKIDAKHYTVRDNGNISVDYAGILSEEYNNAIDNTVDQLKKVALSKELEQQNILEKFNSSWFDNVKEVSIKSIGEEYAAKEREYYGANDEAVNEENLKYTYFSELDKKSTEITDFLEKREKAYFTYVENGLDVQIARKRIINELKQKGVEIDEKELAKLNSLSDEDAERLLILNKEVEAYKEMAEKIEQMKKSEAFANEIDAFAQINQQKSQNDELKEMYQTLANGGNILDLVPTLTKDRELMAQLYDETEGFTNLSLKSIENIYKANNKATVDQLNNEADQWDNRAQALEDYANNLDATNEALLKDSLKAITAISEGMISVEDILGDTGEVVVGLTKDFQTLGKTSFSFFDTISAVKNYYDQIKEKGWLDTLGSLISEKANSWINKYTNEEQVSAAAQAKLGLDQSIDVKGWLNGEAGLIDSQIDQIIVGTKKLYLSQASDYRKQANSLRELANKIQNKINNPASDLNQGGSSNLDYLNKFLEYIQKLEDIENELRKLQTVEDILGLSTNYFSTTVDKQIRLMDEKQKVLEQYMNAQKERLAQLRNSLSSYSNWIGFTEDGRIINKVESINQNSAGYEEYSRIRNEYETIQNALAENEQNHLDTTKNKIELIKNSYIKINEELESMTDKLQKIRDYSQFKIDIGFNYKENAKAYSQSIDSYQRQLEAIRKTKSKVGAEEVELYNQITNSGYGKYLQYDSLYGFFRVTEKFNTEAANGNLSEKIMEDVESMAATSEAIAEARDTAESNYQSIMTELKDNMGNIFNELKEMLELYKDINSRIVKLTDDKIKTLDNNINIYGAEEGHLEKRVELLKDAYENAEGYAKITKEIANENMKNFKNNYKKYVKNVNGEDVIDLFAIENDTNLKAGEKAYIKNLADLVNNSLDEASEAALEAQERLKGVREGFEAIQQSVIDFKNEMVETLKAIDEKEVSDLQKKYEEMNSLDNEYYSSLEKRIQKQRDKRKREQSQTDISQLQQRISILQRDNSGSYSSELANLQKQLRDSLQEQADDNVDLELNRIKEEQEERAKDRELQIKTMENLISFKEDNGLYLTEITELMKGGIEGLVNFYATWLQTQNLSDEELASKVDTFKNTVKSSYKATQDKTLSKVGSVDESVQEVADSIDGTDSTIHDIGTEVKEAFNNYKNDIKGSLADIITELNELNLRLKNEELIKQMEVNAEKWYTSTSIEEKNKAFEANQKKAKEYADLNGIKYFESEEEAFNSKKEGIYNKNGQWVIKDADGTLNPLFTTSRFEISQPNTLDSRYNGEYTEAYRGGESFGNDTAAKQKMIKEGAQFILDKKDEWSRAYGSGADPSKIAEKTLAEFVEKDGDYYQLGWNRDENGVWHTSDGTIITDEMLKRFAEKGYSKGGLVDYTGLAMVHGSNTSPEAFLNAKQTQLFAQLRDNLVANSYSYKGNDTDEATGDIININGIEIAVKELAEVEDINKIVNTIKQSIYKDATSGKSLKLNRR